MKTYPHLENDGIIQLVRKDEHDAVVAELNERLTKQQADMLDTIVERQLEITKWQSLAESLATALDNLSHDCHNHAKDIIQIRWGYDGDCGSKLSAEQIEECCDAAKPALAAYESAKKGELSTSNKLSMFTPCESCEGPLVCSDLGNCYIKSPPFAKSGNLPDPLAEAVKRMEAVPKDEIEETWMTRTGLEWTFDDAMKRVRARLIAAAKGEQP